MNIIKIDQSKNGVRVIVSRWPNGNSTVEADCHCYGSHLRTHSNPRCPLIERGPWTREAAAEYADALSRAYKA